MSNSSKNTVGDKGLIAPEHIKQIQPYIPGKPIDDLVRELGLRPEQVVKLASNENPLGMPESAKQAIEHELKGLGRYPDPGGYALKQVIAKRLDVPAGWITLGNGSNDILELVGMALLEPGYSAVYSQYAFVVYRLATQARGAEHIVVPAKDFGHDLNAMFEAIADNTRVVFIANPNNPTGTFLTSRDVTTFLERVHAAHGNRVTVVLDEAYNEYLPDDIRIDSVALVKRFENLVVSRSFSKAYGLAGLRVGFGLAQPALTDLMARVRQPFNVNSLAQAAAIAAFQDDAFLARSAEVNAAGKKQLQEAFDRLGLTYVPSYANFVLVHVGDANAVNQALLKRGVIVRPVGADGLPEWLRISIGLPEENAILIRAMTEVLGKEAA
ncbi:histidinol-phosphate transaminase [Orrella daihaiensis]|uniref:histidinol-phosphate transaminase n=1 Tax=Orrella daihaiensis TaxID=2782176 RepID=UPI001FB53931|nr:histidinol-phosphate transaminase [Orrella daihaiensis]